MKRIFMSAVALILATAAVQAQTDTTKQPRRAHQRMEKRDGFKDLNLSADQQAKLKTLHEEFKQKRDAVGNEKLTEAERRTQLQTLRAQHKAAAEGILTPAQKEALAKLKTERKKDMGNRKGFRGDSTLKYKPRFDRKTGKATGDLSKQLSLTIEQEAKLKEIRTDFKAKAAAVRSDANLSVDQKHEKMRALKRQQHDQLKNVLTKEQQEKWNALRKDRVSV